MCRMLAVVGCSTVRREWVEAFSRLAESGRTPRNDRSGHPDGWGIAYYGDRIAQYLGRQPMNILGPHSLFPQALGKLSSLRTPLLVAHIRKSPRGIKSIENTHPFICNNWIFAHNGTVQRADEMPLKKYTAEGDTDSERLFKFLLEQMEDEDVYERPAAIRAALARIRDFNSLTFLLSDGKMLYAYRGVKFASDTARGRDKLSYYNLKYAVSRDSLIVCSEETCFDGVINEQWREVGNGQLLTVDIAEPLGAIRP